MCIRDRFDTWQDDKGETHMSLGFTVYGIKKTPLNVLKDVYKRQPAGWSYPTTEKSAYVRSSVQSR